MTEEAEGQPPITMTRMAMGSDVPEWLLVLEPRSEHSRRGSFRFAVDTLLIDMSDHYLLEPAELADRPLLDLSQAVDCRLSAASKPVRLVMALSTFLTAAETPEVPILGAIGEPPELVRKQHEQALRDWESRYLGPAADRIARQHLQWGESDIHRIAYQPGLFRRWWLALFG